MQEIITIRNYIQIYIWRILSLMTGFLTLLIVVPYFSSNAELYGVYAFCISISLYLSYADIGFLNSGQKYAAEHYAKGDIESELKTIGFTYFILIMMFLPFSVSLIFLSLNPFFLINDLTLEGAEIASDLLLIVGIVTPVQIILQRLAHSITSIRLQDHVSTRVEVLFNCIRVFPIFYFFHDGRYLISEYFLTSTLISVLGGLVTLILIRKRFVYKFSALFSFLKFSRSQFDLTKKLALSTLFSTIGFIIFYEIDLIIIGNLFGSLEVAIYAIAFTFLNFLRTVISSFYNPFLQRFNHFSIEKSGNRLSEIFYNLVHLTLPIYLISVTILILSYKHLVIFWVGSNYFESIFILQILTFGMIFGFLSQPAGHYYIAKERYKYIYINAIFSSSTFILLNYLFLNNLGIEFLALSKTLIFFGLFLLSIIGTIKIINLFNVIKQWLISGIIFVFLAYFTFQDILIFIFPEPEKDSLKFLLFISFLFFVTAISYSLMIISNKTSRNILKKLYCERNE